MAEFDTLQTKELSVERNFTVAGRNGRPAYFQALVGAKMGDYFNASKSQLHFGSAGTGEVTGLASVHNAELYLPNKTLGGGSYCIYEGNMNFQANTVVHSVIGIPLCLINLKVGGTQTGIDTWEDSAGAGILNLSGLSAADGSVFATGTGGAMAASLRILIDGVAYYIMLATTPSTA